MRKRVEQWGTQTFGWQPRFRGNYDVVALAHLHAAQQSAEFYTEHMLNAKEFDVHEALIEHAVGLSGDGLYLELGVATGRTITAIAQCAPGAVYGFDSFEGLPESWYGEYGRGAFSRTDLPAVPENVTLVKGLFDATLPKFLAEHEGDLAFLHVDCDLYSSTSYAFSVVRERIRPGTVILFDEYFNYPGWQQHEHRALMELVEDAALKIRYDSFLKASQPVCVVVEDIGSGNA